MGGGSPTYNYPKQPTYGEGMADALKAQVNLLQGKGDFAGTGGLAGLLPLERDVRELSAQMDTDILRQTILGSTKDETVSGTFDDEGRLVIGEREGTPEKRQGKPLMTITKYPQGGGKYKFDVVFKDPFTNRTISSLSKIDPPNSSITNEFQLIQSFESGNAGQYNNAYNKAQQQAVFEIPGDPVPIYGKDAEGKLIVDKSRIGETADVPISSKDRAGMIDLLGDQQITSDGRKPGFSKEGEFLGLSALAEDIQRGNLSRQREADLADVESLSGRFQDVMADYKPAATSGVDGARALLEEQKDKLTEGGGVITKPEGSTFASGLEGQTMSAAKVGQGPTLDAQTSYNPSASVSGGTFGADTSYTASELAKPMSLTADTSYKPSASVKGKGYTATAGVDGGNIGADTLRAALLADAESALGQGLTEREQAQIANSARARQTLMGRTFDQAGAIQEAQALVAEDNNRRMQNRGFAQSALGQEADIQRDDLGRGLQAQLQNQAAKNQAAQFGASQDMQAQLANQAATNQAAQAGLQAGLSQEALAAQQAQAKAMADASAANQASQFGVSAGLQQESQANQAALQAQLANQSATNQARAAGLQAGLSQDAQQAQLDQASNLAQAELTQQAKAFGAQSAQQAALANQAQQQQANQFAVGATMDAERIDESLRQQGLGNYINAVGNLAQIEDKFMLDPFQALLGRGGGNALQQGQSVFGQANYGLSSGPQYLNPEAGLGYISNMAANQANMYGANVAADASRSSGLMGGLGAIGGGLLSNASLFCWVAREVYGPANPAWMQFREWMFTESPQWFFELYRKYGERFASWISDKPRLKGIIRKWMDSKIGDK
jgi:hypothetical protein